jgi:hypothetical protein
MSTSDLADFRVAEFFAAYDYCAAIPEYGVLLRSARKGRSLKQKSKSGSVFTFTAALWGVHSADRVLLGEHSLAKASRDKEA